MNSDHKDQQSWEEKLKTLKTKGDQKKEGTNAVRGHIIGNQNPQQERKIRQDKIRRGDENEEG